MRESINPIITPSIERRFWEHVPSRPNDGCWNWRDEAHGGYSTLWIGPGNIKITGHRLSWLMHFGPVPKGLCVCHHCDNKRCVRPHHLYLATSKQNNRDAWARGLCESIRRREYDRTGENGPGAKLTWSQVRDIRERYAGGGVAQRELAAEFGVSRGHISGIVTRKFWPVHPAQEF